MQSIKVVAPCSSANLGSGFDVFGLALEVFHDIVVVELIDNGIEIFVSGKYARNIPCNPDKNTAGLVAKHILANRNIGVRIHLDKGIISGMGLGSSGASAAACAVALNYLLDLKLSTNELIKVAAGAETVSAGVPHADNVAASILGGFTLARSWLSSFSAIRLNPPENLEVILALPNLKTPRKKTAVARSVLPKHVRFADAIVNAGNAALLLAGIHFGDIEMIGEGMDDIIVEPARKKLIPGYDCLKKAAFDSGAAGVSISGAGPAVIAIADNTRFPTQDIAYSMKDAYRDIGLKCDTYCSKPSYQGTVRII